MGQSKSMSRLKLAEQLITQRRRVTESTINEFEHVEINKLRTELNNEFELSDLAQEEAAARTKQYTEQHDIDAKRSDEIRNLDAELLAEQQELAMKFGARRQKINEKFMAMTSKSKEAYKTVQEALEVAREGIENKLRERSIEVQQKAAQMRTQLGHDSQAAIDKLYEAELSPELKAAIDSIPSIASLSENSPRLSYKKD